tara:strand:- start:817 stop:1125 length:309 start_codon:yes stop_codon:yes gene_type:complete
MKIKIILTISIALLFVITTIMAIVSAGGLIDVGIKKIIGYDECGNEARVPKLVAEENVTEEIDDSWCRNSEKRDIARNLSLLIVSLPLAILFYRRVRVMLKE